MTTLHTMKDTTRDPKSSRRVGRGPGCGKGKTSGRGQKGAGSRSGYKRRLGYEGGQMRLHMKLPQRGFSNVRFQKRLDGVNLWQVEKYFNDGDRVDLKALQEKGLVPNNSHGVKILGNGELKKKVTFSVDALSKGAQEKLEKAKISIESK